MAILGRVSVRFASQDATKFSVVRAFMQALSQTNSQCGHLATVARERPYRPGNPCINYPDQIPQRHAEQADGLARVLKLLEHCKEVQSSWESDASIRRR